MSDEPSESELNSCYWVAWEAAKDEQRSLLGEQRQIHAGRRALYNAGKEAGRASMQCELEEAMAQLEEVKLSREMALARIAALEAGQVNAAVEMLFKEADANETYGIEYFVAAKWLEENTGVEARAVRVTLGEFLASRQSAYWWACYTPGSVEVTICTADEAERSGYHVVAHASRPTLDEAIAAAVDAAVLHFRNPAVQDAIDKLASDRRERKPERCPACGGTGITGYWEQRKDGLP